MHVCLIYHNAEMEAIVVSELIALIIPPFDGEISD
jgi:hypothetical protein